MLVGFEVAGRLDEGRHFADCRLGGRDFDRPGGCSRLLAQFALAGLGLAAPAARGEERDGGEHAAEHRGLGSVSRVKFDLKHVSAYSYHYRLLNSLSDSRPLAPISSSLAADGRESNKVIDIACCMSAPPLRAAQARSGECAPRDLFSPVWLTVN